MKKNHLSIICAACFFLVLFSIYPAQAQFPSANRSTITGYVFDPERRPLSQIPVELMNDVNSVIQRTRTNGAGRFFFSGLSGGRFTIRVLPLGTNLEEQTQEVELVTFGGLGRHTPDNIHKDIYLSVRRNDNGAPSVTGTVFAQEVPEDARKSYEKAVSALDDKKLDEGIAGLEGALKIFPTYYMALERLGTVYIAQQKYENAADIFARAVAVNDRSFNGWYGLSYANYSMKKSNAAIEAAQKAVALNANSVEAQMFLGITQRQAALYESAEKSLLQAKKLAKGKSPDVSWNLALLYAHNMKRYKEAADELELFLKADPDAPNKEAIKKLIKQFRENPPSK
jgi:tetratricopeptide (TPR) repeat protein